MIRDWVRSFRSTTIFAVPVHALLTVLAFLLFLTIHAFLVIHYADIPTIESVGLHHCFDPHSPRESLTPSALESITPRFTPPVYLDYAAQVYLPSHHLFR